MHPELFTARDDSFYVSATQVKLPRPDQPIEAKEYNDESGEVVSH